LSSWKKKLGGEQQLNKHTYLLLKDNLRRKLIGVLEVILLMNY